MQYPQPVAHAGVTFVDFETGSLLQITGRARIAWHAPADAAPGAAAPTATPRVVTLSIEGVTEQRGVLPLRWAAPAPPLPLRLAKVARESADVKSFYLEPTGGAPLPPFAPGQHLPIEVAVGGSVHKRTYTLSGPPVADGPAKSPAGGSRVEQYRLTIKREPHGTVSQFMHDSVAAGATIAARSPAGEFVVPTGQTRSFWWRQGWASHRWPPPHTRWWPRAALGGLRSCTACATALTTPWPQSYAPLRPPAPRCA